MLLAFLDFFGSKRDSFATGNEAAKFLSRWKLMFPGNKFVTEFEIRLRLPSEYESKGDSLNGLKFPSITPIELALRN